MNEEALRASIRSQYRAALAMLAQTIERCPAGLWTEGSRPSPYWRVAYHALFYCHFYLQPTMADFRGWAKHRKDHQLLGDRLPFPPHTPIPPGEPYTPTELLEYLEACRAEVDRLVPTLDLDAPSGFEWLPFGKLELQLYSIRHLMQHVGELGERLNAEAGVEIDWVGRA